jgi:hypothetical protein
MSDCCLRSMGGRRALVGSEPPTSGTRAGRAGTRRAFGDRLLLYCLLFHPRAQRGPHPGPDRGNCCASDRERGGGGDGVLGLMPHGLSKGV